MQSRQVKEDLNAEDDQVKAIDIALGMEESAYKFYKDTADACENADAKEMLLKIANEENEHYRILDDTRLYLTNQAEWFIKEEKPVIGGGRSTMKGKCWTSWSSAAAVLDRRGDC